MKKLLLSLGALSAVVAPVAAVVACGSEDQTSVEKTSARGLLDYYHFDKKTEDAFRAEISKAKSASAVDSIIEKIKAKGEPWKEAQDALVAPKSTAHNLIDGFTLSNKEKTDYENKIKGAQSQKEIDDIVGEARTKSSGNDVSDEVKRQQGFAISTINQDDLLPKDKAAAIEEINNAKTETDVQAVPIKYAHRTYKETVHIGIALSGEFAVQADEIGNGQFVYFPKTAKVGDKVTWTDTSTPASTKTVIYEVSSIGNGGVPVISVTINGTKSPTPAVVDTLKGVAMVLTDYTGTYLVKGVADKDVFEDNKQIRDFLNTYIEKMKSGDIINKWDELKATFKYISPSETLNTISYDNTNQKFVLSHNG